jgi:hypothetical protein
VAGVVAVALVAAAISYDHQNHLAATHGQPPILAAIWPLCTDGMIASCATTVALDRAGGFRPRAWAVSGFWLGVAVSILTNWLATSGGLIAHGVSAFPALAFLITIEALSSKPKSRKMAASVVTEAPAVTLSGVGIEPHPTPTVAAKPVAVRRVPAAAKKTTTTADRIARAWAITPGASAAELARKLKVSESTVRRHRPAAVTVPAAAS